MTKLEELLRRHGRIELTHDGDKSWATVGYVLINCDPDPMKAIEKASALSSEHR